MDAMPPAPPTPESPQPSSGLTDRQWAVFLNLSPLLSFVVPGVVNIVAPLVIWLIKKPDSAFLDRVGREVLNFQISFSIYLAVAAALCLVLIGWVLLPITGVIWFILTIIGSVKAGNGEEYRYPLTIRLL